ncbi:MAG TPA: hypothetical protein DCQ26_15725 [Marinilabiliales bacterium]|nr:MAG: hypothetical protein A2W84_04960 [Bacteroidetes bacterium GWC2_40_13]OFX75504.1 MAG: hypothetical protein A2W96_08610 [Bacteroidetes bacterium GWD2_40_43]OFX94020.1 MAG: hypothetical protein A2W97_14535 [Bacteroidetes bacterium GWE2_40_63]OFY19806.1 MAG: hypothetical protein A2W88_03405 [Bacteroidetes bacterium GWF2_40_13]OFZ28218.1 MAG: hypothetical protein A2437_04905 [Bacteroidetes bacterium RIFOXYC2_FULL_40_12]HAN00049.1 hypothetical protein [Marinilabiliales bacterium]
MKLIAPYGNAGCGIRDETGTRKGFNLIGFNYLTRFEVNILFMVKCHGFHPWLFNSSGVFQQPLL